MLSNSAANNNRLVQVIEQVLDPLRVPIIIGNEMYMVTQRDVRNIVDTRLISWEKLQGNNSNNSPIQSIPPHVGGLQDLINYILNIGQCAQSKPLFVDPAQVTNMFNPPNLNATHDCPQKQAVAPIQTQLDWEMRCVENSLPPDQFSYSKKTSTTDLKRVRFSNPERVEICCCPKFTSRGVNITDDDFKEESSTEPSAREQLKQKKIMQSSEQ